MDEPVELAFRGSRPERAPRHPDESAPNWSGRMAHRMGRSRWGLIGGLVTSESDSRAQRPTARLLDRGLIQLEGVLLPPRRGLIRLEGQLMRLEEQLMLHEEQLMRLQEQLMRLQEQLMPLQTCFMPHEPDFIPNELAFMRHELVFMPDELPFIGHEWVSKAA